MRFEIPSVVVSDGFLAIGPSINGGKLPPRCTSTRLGSGVEDLRPGGSPDGARGTPGRGYPACGVLLDRIGDNNALPRHVDRVPRDAGEHLAVSNVHAQMKLS